MPAYLRPLCWFLSLAAFQTGFSPLVTHAQHVVATIPAGDPAIRINELIAANWETDRVEPASRCSDRVFVRRVYLDLAGRVPKPSEVESFLHDTSDDRRDKLIDSLLASEDYIQHFADLFDAVLMGRTSEARYAERTKHRWRSYLENVFRENRPWNEIVAEILLARKRDEADQGAVWYLYERNDNHQQIAEAIAPGIFGIRIECAQCHDHMTADEISQADYWGLVAFFSRSKNVETDNGPRVAESAVGGFSEFADIAGNSSPNLLTFVGADVVPEQRPGPDGKQQDADSLYRAAESAGEPRVPKFSRREQFVSRILRDHPLVARAAVNRLWAILMSRGIVHPYDEMDSVHPPSHSELLDFLSDEFVASGYNMRRIIRAIVRSDAYQLDSQRPAADADPASFAWYLERPLTAEQLARSIALILRGNQQPDRQLIAIMRQQFTDVLPEQYVGTVADSLFLSNNVGFDEYIRGSRQSHHLVPKLAAIADDAERVETLFQVVFGRSPDAEEQKIAIQYLYDRGEVLRNALQQVLWAMLTSAEFRLNH